MGHEEISALRELVQQLKGDVQDARDVALRLISKGHDAVTSIDEGNALEARGELQAALDQADETISAWPGDV